MPRLRTATIAALVLAAGIAGTGPAMAGPGAWDHVGTKPFINGITYDYTEPVHSAGGDFRACVTTSGYYRLREDDTDLDDLVHYDFEYFPAGACRDYLSIGGWVDGSNNRAEFYLERNSVGAGSAVYYD
ncbi:hypothetical protein ACTWP5_11330 [Streptomyces sp. 4N509B]|uniref:hypothetical protein n=1 Tax=Streptomyces sp. 4N509B TaxID=3457413 RepID=UPI003FD52442